MPPRLLFHRSLVVAGACVAVAMTGAAPVLAQGHLAGTVTVPARTAVAATLTMRVLPDSVPDADDSSDVTASGDDLLAPGSGMTIVDRYGHDLRDQPRDTVGVRPASSASSYARTGSAARARLAPISAPPSTAPSSP